MAKVQIKIREALDKDPDLLCDRDKVSETLGHNPAYLEEVLGITKSDLIRLERRGLAVKARYVVERTKEHRIRWIIFKEAIE